MPERLMVTGLEPVEPARWSGKVQFPNRLQPTAILVFACGSAHVGVRAHCPHEGENLTRCPLDSQRRLVCPRHGLPVRLDGPDAFRVEGAAPSFVVPWPLERPA